MPDPIPGRGAAVEPRLIAPGEPACAHGHGELGLKRSARGERWTSGIRVPGRRGADPSSRTRVSCGQRTGGTCAPRPWTQDQSRSTSGADVAAGDGRRWHLGERCTIPGRIDQHHWQYVTEPPPAARHRGRERFRGGASTRRDASDGLRPHQAWTSTDHPGRPRWHASRPRRVARPTVADLRLDFDPGSVQHPTAGRSGRMPGLAAHGTRGLRAHRR